MPGYSMRAQTTIVVATMGVHNFLQRNDQLDEDFMKVEEEADDEVEIDLPMKKMK